MTGEYPAFKLAGGDCFIKDSGIDIAKNKIANNLGVLVGSSTEVFKKVGPVALCWTTSTVGVRPAWRGQDLASCCVFVIENRESTITEQTVVLDFMSAL